MDKNQWPLFSILLPTYNRLELLKQALVSAQRQDYPNLEIIVINNGSDDGTFEYLQECALKDLRLRIVTREKTLPVLINLSSMLDEVQGRYCLVLCDDDVLASGLCERAVELMEQNENLSLYVSKVDYFYGLGHYEDARKLVFKKTQLYSEVLTGADFIKKRLDRKFQMAWCGTVYRIEILRQRGGFTLLNSMDLQSMCLTAYDYSVFMDNWILAHYRIHQSNSSNTCWMVPASIFQDLRDCMLGVKNICVDSSLDIYFVKYIIFCCVFESKLVRLGETFKFLLQLSEYFGVGKLMIYRYVFFTSIYRIWRIVGVYFYKKIKLFLKIFKC